jgi:hypothetical protein
MSSTSKEGSEVAALRIAVASLEDRLVFLEGVPAVRQAVLERAQRDALAERARAWGALLAAPDAAARGALLEGMSDISRSAFFSHLARLPVPTVAKFIDGLGRESTLAIMSQAWGGAAGLQQAITVELLPAAHVPAYVRVTSSARRVVFGRHEISAADAAALGKHPAIAALLIDEGRARREIEFTSTPAIYTADAWAILLKHLTTVAPVTSLEVQPVADLAERRAYLLADHRRYGVSIEVLAVKSGLSLPWLPPRKRAAE